MIRTPWSRLARSAFVRLIQRASLSRDRFRARSMRRLRRAYSAGAPLHFLACPVEVLEQRQLLFAPVAINDSYSVSHDHTLAPGASTGVLANDMNMGGGTLTAILVTGVSDGSLTLNSNGSFTYNPTAHFVGSDSFTYKAYNGTDYSGVATASLSVVNHAPSTTADSYTVYKDVYNSANEGAAGVLANDSDSDGDTLTASLVTGPSHGALTLHSDGSFIYTPTAGYYGSDSFVYAASDGLTSTNGTASFTVASPFSAQTNTPDDPFTGFVSLGNVSASELTGEIQSDFSLVQGHDLAYSSLTADVKPIVVVETTFTGGTTVPAPDSIEVRMTFGSLSATTIYFTNSGLSTNANVFFADQIDASSLATGHYQYSMSVISHYGTTTSTRVFSGYQDIVNRTSSGFGPGWNLAELDSLSVGTGGVLWVGGKSGTAWFTDIGGGAYSSPAGPMFADALVKNGDGTYTLTDKVGNKENFSSAGLLTSRVDLNGNTFSYAYSSGKLSTITDPYGRTTTFTYTSGLVTSITDVAGKITTLGDTSGQLASITAPDPDGAGPLSAPVTAYAYGSSNRLSSVTDPLSHVTSLTYGFSGRVSQITFADTNNAQFTPIEVDGLVNIGAGVGTSSNPAAPYVPGSITAGFLDEMGHTQTIKLDRFGNVLSFTDPLSLTTTYTRDSNGLVTQMTQPDPDGGGPLTSPVTGYQYDSKGNMTRVTYADSSYETWSYDSTLNKPLTHTDQRGKTTSFSYDSHGNLLTITDALSNVTTLAYSTAGKLTSVTLPDPDGAGPLTSPVTSYTYDTDGRITRITNPDGTHRDYTWDSEDRLLTAADELGRTTTYAYDNDGNLISITQPDPDGAGPLTAPVTTLSYDAAGNIASMTDALGNVTSFSYNSRNWLTSVTAPDPDGAGPLAAPVTSYAYNANGWKTSMTDPMGNVTSYGYDSDGRLTSVTGPDPDGAGPLSAPVTGITYDNLGRITVETDPLSHTKTFAYNSINQVTSTTDGLGKTTSYTYDSVGDVLTVTVPDPDGAGPLKAPVTTYTYSDTRQLLTATDPMSNVTTYAYDHDGRLTTVTAPDPDGAGPLAAPVVTVHASGSSDGAVRPAK